MSRYIDAEQARAEMIRAGFHHSDMTVSEFIESLPAADVKEVRHGEWIDTGFGGIHGDTLYRCSCCGEEREAYVDEERFCPNCGAKMDENR